MFILTILGLLMVVGGVVWLILNKNHRRDRYYDDEENKKDKKNRFAKQIRLIVAGVLVFVLSCSCTIVPTGYTGVKVVFGQINPNPVPNGIVFHLPFVETVDKVCNKQQNMNIKGEVWGETIAPEKTPVYAANIDIAYRVSHEKSAWIAMNVKNTDDLLTESLVSSSVKSAMSQFEAEVVTVRNSIEPSAKVELQKSMDETYGEGTITIVKVTINNMDFEPSYNEAIAQKSIAKQRQQTQKIENETAIARADAEKKVAITEAEAQAESEKVKASANAEVIRITAEAEAEANRKVAESLTELFVEHEFYETWNGIAPEVMGSGAVITDIRKGMTD